ncbi:MAG: glycine/sarcosine/betaine reductase complex component C subunit beta [Tissierellia bacterium]|nr:glycine/sarcosine/betaine reductase complex component C subunit beta [Tissierellia bacterium]
MNFPVLKGAAYVLINTPHMIINNGSTCSTERIVNPDSEFLKEVKNNIRSFEEVVNYLPNQVYIGNLKPEELKNYKEPWVNAEYKEGKADGKMGAIIPEEEFIAIMKICDSFDLVHLSEDFVNEMKPIIEEKYPEFENFFGNLKAQDISDAKQLIENHKAEALYHNGEICGYVRQAHDIDVNLSAHTIFENTVSKASGVLSAIELFRKSNIDAETIDYIIECSEEACGDVNQRGGGNFAKAIGEIAGIKNATGSDTRGFCAAPMHAIVEASALVKSGVFKNVLVVAGGSTAKLGMNAKDHVKKGLPVLEDVVAGFAVLVSENDGINPILRTDIVGRHTVSTGSSPQGVITALVLEQLKNNGLKLTDIDKYSVEMQNPDITKPAGAGNVPEANYKMIAALAVREGEIDRKGLIDFIDNHGLPGWAPTQGHIPSGVPYVGHMIEDLTNGDLNRTMLVGKGSLFLGRMTNLFDGISIVCERNSGKVSEGASISEDEIRKIIAEAMRDLAENLLKDRE